jgi:citrate lyase beta subunit
VRSVVLPKVVSGDDVRAVERLERAAAVLAALKEAEDAGRAAAVLDGERIDEASRKLALQIAARARAAGIELPQSSRS